MPDTADAAQPTWSPGWGLVRTNLESGGWDYYIIRQACLEQAIKLLTVSGSVPAKDVIDTAKMFADFVFCVPATTK